MSDNNSNDAMPETVEVSHYVQLRGNDAYRRRTNAEIKAYVDTVMAEPERTRPRSPNKPATSANGNG